MFESSGTESPANTRKHFRSLLVSGGLHLAAIGILAMSHEPLVVTPQAKTVFQRIALVAPPMFPELRHPIERPRFHAPRAADDLVNERWAAAPPPERELSEPALPVPKFIIAAEPLVTDEAAPHPSPVQLPEPAVRMGVFDAGDGAIAGLPTPRPATMTGGFVDPATSQKWGGAKLVAQVGEFGSARWHRSTRGAASDREVAPAGFSEAESANATPTKSSGHPVTVGKAFGASQAANPEAARVTDVRATSFGVPTTPEASPRRRLEGAPVNFDGDVEIVSKPRPQYTDEARKLGVEGEVVLEVLFGANGEVRVKRMLSGLGHGLDERAVEAASRISFLPARRDGKAVDIVATVRIQFQLA